MRSKLPFFLIIAFTAVSALAFRPAPPPGTPAFKIEQGVEIEYAYIDAVVMDTMAQIVFIASLRVSHDADSIVLFPNWPMDSIRIFQSMNIDPAEDGVLLRSGERAVIYIKEKPLVIRASFETSVRRALTGPPGEWSYGNVIAVYPPFESTEGEILDVPIFQARLILPPTMKPIADDAGFVVQDMLPDFVSWQFFGVGITRMHIFQTK
ncbi:MAG TPA: hypothetical protein ENN07_02565 [candidate division Zixibacteria bacterium]|nr:hypothetical protein [candidate division Zixibacteria bacterium]